MIVEIRNLTSGKQGKNNELIQELEYIWTREELVRTE